MTKEQLKKLVSENYIQQVFDILRQATGNNSRFNNDVIAQAARFKKYSWSGNIGIISRPEERQEHAIVVNSLLQTIDDIPEVWLAKVSIPVDARHLFEGNQPERETEIPPVKSSLIQWLMMGFLVITFGLGAWWLLGGGKTETPEKVVVTPPSSSMSDTKPSTSESKTDAPVSQSTKPKEPVSPQQADTKSIKTEKEIIPAKPATKLEKNNGATSTSDSKASSFLGIWQNPKIDANTTQKLEITQEGGKVNVHVIGKHGDMGTFFGKVVSDTQLTLNDFEYNEHWYRDFSIELLSNKSLKCKYNAHLDKVWPVDDTLNKN